MAYRIKIIYLANAYIHYKKEKELNKDILNTTDAPLSNTDDWQSQCGNLVR